MMWWVNIYFFISFPYFYKAKAAVHGVMAMDGSFCLFQIKNMK